MSANELMLDVSQAAELKLAFRRHGWTNAQIKTLSEGTVLGDVLQVINGRSEIKKIEHWIDTETDAKEFNTYNLAKVKRHEKSKRFDFMMAKMFLYQSPKQKKSGGKSIFVQEDGISLIKKLKTKSSEGYITLNGNVLEYLLEHQEIIPKEWRDKNIFFFGTEYYDFGGSGMFRFMHYNGRRWETSLRFNDGNFKKNDFIVLLEPRNPIF